MISGNRVLSEKAVSCPFVLPGLESSGSRQFQLLFSVVKANYSRAGLFRHALSIILLLVLALFNQTPGYSAAPSAKELVAKADTYRGLGMVPFSFHLKIISHQPDKKPGKNGLKVLVKGDRSIVRFLSPKRLKGRAMLFEGRNLWFHIPRTRKIIRMSPAQRLMGESSNGDVAATDFSGDYHPVLNGLETLKDTECYYLTLTAVDRKVTYARIEYWVSKRDGKPVKSKHYAASGKLLKTAYYKSFIKVGNQEKLERLLLVNPIFKGRYTWMIYSRYQKEDLPDSLFQKQSLNRL